MTDSYEAIYRTMLSDADDGLPSDAAGERDMMRPRALDSLASAAGRAS
jgi:hypothetical protein